MSIVNSKVENIILASFCYFMKYENFIFVNFCKLCYCLNKGEQKSKKLVLSFTCNPKKEKLDALAKKMNGKISALLRTKLISKLNYMIKQ